jgi:DNA-binding phage protein
MSRVCSALDNDREARSVLDMITLECEDCGRRGTDGYETHAYIGARRKKYVLKRCVDRAACAMRAKEEMARVHADIALEVEQAAHTIVLLRQDVKAAEAELAEQVKYALEQGVGVTQVARAAGLSRERIYQIKDGRR